MAINFKNSFIDQLIDKINNQESTYYFLSLYTHSKNNNKPTINFEFKASRRNLYKKFVSQIRLNYFFLGVQFVMSESSNFFSDKFNDILEEKLISSDSFYFDLCSANFLITYTIGRYENLNDEVKNKIEYVLKEYDDKLEGIIKHIDDTRGLVKAFDDFDNDFSSYSYFFLEDKTGIVEKLSEYGVDWAYRRVLSFKDRYERKDLMVYLREKIKNSN